MANIANVSITSNPAGTDAAVTHYPVKVENGVAMWIDRTNPVIALQSIASMTMVDTATMRKTSGQIILPFLDPNDATLVHKGFFSFMFAAPLVSTRAYRWDLSRRGQTFMPNSIVSNCFLDNDRVT